MSGMASPAPAHVVLSDAFARDRAVWHAAASAAKDGAAGFEAACVATTDALAEIVRETHALLDDGLTSRQRASLAIREAAVADECQAQLVRVGDESWNALRAASQRCRELRAAEASAMASSRPSYHGVPMSPDDDVQVVHHDECEGMRRPVGVALVRAGAAAATLLWRTALFLGATAVCGAALGTSAERTRRSRSTSSPRDEIRSGAAAEFPIPSSGARERFGAIVANSMTSSR